MSTYISDTTSSARSVEAAMPSFLIIGAQKGGTTAIARNLAQHPELSIFSGVTEYGQKEIEFFNQHWDRGIAWYIAHFRGATGLIGEKTAELLHRTICHERMYSVNPHFKLVVLLRCPVERAYSQWRMAAMHKKDEDRSFEQVVAQELSDAANMDVRSAFYTCADMKRSSWRQGYLLKGLYAEQLTSLYRWFPPTQVCIVISEAIRTAADLEYSRLCSFLDVNPSPVKFAEHFVGRTAPPMERATRRRLQEFYAIPNTQLFSMLGKVVQEWF